MSSYRRLDQVRIGSLAVQRTLQGRESVNRSLPGQRLVTPRKATCQGTDCTPVRCHLRISQVPRWRTPRCGKRAVGAVQYSSTEGDSGRPTDVPPRFLSSRVRLGKWFGSRQRWACCVMCSHPSGNAFLAQGATHGKHDRAPLSSVSWRF